MRHPDSHPVDVWVWFQNMALDGDMIKHSPFDWLFGFEPKNDPSVSFGDPSKTSAVVARFVEPNNDGLLCFASDYARCRTAD
jgi:hypothetical protein